MAIIGDYGGRILARIVGWIHECGTALVGPLADAARTAFTPHMAAHLLLGMAAPLLLVLAAPVTLALRALPVARARTLSRLLRTPPVRAVTRPVVAGTLNAGGLWVLDRRSSGLLFGSAIACVVVLVLAWLTGAALMNWGRAPTTVKTFIDRSPQ